MGAPPSAERPSLPGGVAAWRRRPVWWVGAVLLLIVLFEGELVADAARERGIVAAGRAVDGEVLGSWDGGDQAPVRYRIDGGDPRHALAWRPDLADAAVGPAPLVVDPQRPERVHLAAFDWWRPPVLSAVQWLPIVLLMVAWWAVRRRTVGLADACFGRSGPVYRMVAVPAPGRISHRRWVLHLYAVDAHPGASPVCTVPVIGGTEDLGPRPVDVRGEPRPGGFVAVSDLDGTRWWPAGRALLTGSAPLPAAEAGAPARYRRRGGWWWAVTAAGVLLLLIYFSAGEDSETLQARADRVVVEVLEARPAGVSPVPVAYRWEGRDRTASVRLAGPQELGDRFELAVDPQDPQRLWQPGTRELLPGEAPLSDLLLVVGLVLVPVGITLARSARGRDGRPLG